MTSLTPHRDATLAAIEVMLANTAQQRAENSVGGCCARIIVALQQAQGLAIADEADAGRDPNLICAAVEHAIANCISAATGSFTGSIDTPQALSFASNMALQILLKMPGLVGPNKQNASYNYAEVAEVATGRA